MFRNISCNYRIHNHKLTFRECKKDIKAHESLFFVKKKCESDTCQTTQQIKNSEVRLCG